MLSAGAVLTLLAVVYLVLRAREDVKTRLERHNLRAAARRWDEDSDDRPY